MKRNVLSIFLMIVFSAVFAQYQGQPWNDTPWNFGQDTVANLTVGKDYETRRGPYNGIPHYLYDIGKVDTLLRPSADPEGKLVAGSGANVMSDGTQEFRIEAAVVDAITLDESDIAAIRSPNYGGTFSTRVARATIQTSGGWYRYTCNFEPGNYKLMLRSWGSNTINQAFWVRFYDKATMEPLYPWTRVHPGSGDGDPTLQEGLAYIDVNVEPWNTVITRPDNPPNLTNWMVLFDEFSLSGDVVFEYVDIGPSALYGDYVGGGGSLGEISFIYAGEMSDKFAPVIEPWKNVYDDLDELELTLSEAGTFYIVPDGTPEEEIETANIDKVEMTTEDNYNKPVSEFLDDDISSVQFYTKDPAGNSRITSSILFRTVIVPDILVGNQGDEVGFHVTREGMVFLVPKGTQTDLPSLMAAHAAGNADMVEVLPGRDTLLIQNLSGNMNLEFLLFDAQIGKTSRAVDFKLGDGEATSVAELDKVKVSVYVDRGTIFLSHNGEFEELYIYDALGRQRTHQKVSSNRITINASDFTDGVYIYRLYGRNSEVSTGKFLINNRY